MKHFKVNLFVGVVAAVLLALLLAPAVAQAAAWSVVQSPNATPGNNELHAVASVSANDVWAVGTSENNLGNTPTLIEHWNGTAWSIVPSPSPDGAFNDLFGVAAVSTSDVWAVGDSGSGTLIEQWNGSSWSVVSSPNPGSGSSPGDSLRGAAADPNSGQTWAVGQFTAASGATQTLTEFNP